MHQPTPQAKMVPNEYGETPEDRARVSILLMREDIPQNMSETNTDGDTFESSTTENAEGKLGGSSFDDFNDNNISSEKEESGYTGLHRLCILPQGGPLDAQWEDVRQYLSRLSKNSAAAMQKLTSTQKDGYDYTPIHVACSLSPPVDVIRQMIKLCPECVIIPTKDGDSPLGLACGGIFPARQDVIKELVMAYPEARDDIDARGKTPLHIHFKSCKTFELNPIPAVVKLLATEDSVNTRDKKGHSPMYRLADAALNAFSLLSSLVRMFEPPNRAFAKYQSSLSSSSEEEEYPCFDCFHKSLKIVLDHAPARDSKTLFLRDLLHLPPSLRTMSFDKKITREVINNVMGRGPYIALLMMDFYVQSMVAAAFTIGCFEEFQRKEVTNFMIAGGIYWFVRRSSSTIGSSDMARHFFEPWHLSNVFHIAVLLASSFYLRNNGIALEDEGESGTWRNLLILTGAMIWLQMMGITCHISKGFSVFVNASIQIFKKIIYLLMVCLIIFMSFSTMFYLSAVDSVGFCIIDPNDCTNPEEECPVPGSYCTMEDSMAKVYNLFFGTLEAGDFEVPLPTQLILFFFNIVVVVLLLNIIIAIMSDSYSAVSESSALIFWDHRFELIHEVDAVINCFTGFNCSKNNPKAQKIAKDEGNGTLHHEWFTQLLQFKRDTNIPAPVINFFIKIVIFLWIIVGFLTFGTTWPRHARRTMFAPSAADKSTEDEPEETIEDGEDEKTLLQSEAAKLTKENKALRKAIYNLQNNSKEKAQQTLRDCAMFSSPR